MNKITLTGRLTEEPKVTYSAGAEPVAHAVFNFAVPDMSMKKMEKGTTPQTFSDAPAGAGSLRSWTNIVAKAQNFSSVDGLKTTITRRTARRSIPMRL